MKMNSGAMKQWVKPTVEVAKMATARSHVSGTYGDGVFTQSGQGYS